MLGLTNWLEHVYVDGLHGSIDIDVSFNPGINIIYGDNGVGKTTLLHIISNIANFDFERFNYLKFSFISFTMSNGDRIDLLKRDGSSVPQVMVNQRRLSVSDDSPRGSEVERELFSQLFGKSPVYIPAFRNVLQKIDERSSGRWNALVDLNLIRGLGARSDGEQTVDAKTAQCRSWFGDFVPTIRFPSVEEVEQELETYWSRADSAARREESKMISEATNKILADLLGSEPESMKNLIERILQSAPDHLTEKEYMAEDFSRAIANAGRKNSSKEIDPNSLAAIYIDALIKAQAKQKSLFYKANRFVESMNEFLLPSREFQVSGEYSGKGKPRINFRNSDRPGYGVGGLSSGERQLLTLLYSAWTQPGESNLMLVDEPEISLHIDWQRQILTEMHKQSKQQIIACTHAPEVAADIEEGYQVFERISRFGKNE
ncbi:MULTISPECIES: AAA family ATPase [unclassified Yoonia]|uniref:AAA family ATPase n=1 Tax=unclassified Yoonia TaxID=2629118 RepID=UPI002AFE237D|nr:MULTISPECIES: AAA family ATPase [unclassified Yoonia]